MKGYAGSIAVVDLTARSVSIEPLQEKLCHRFLGGHGIGQALAHRFIPARTDPLGSDNAVILSAGLLSGTTAPAANKVGATAKLPLSRTIGTCSGSMVSQRMKAAGFDHVVIKGISEKPVWLLIRNSRIEIHDASDLYGLTVPEVRHHLEKILGAELDTISIGPAGERLVKFSMAMINRGITLGRGGLGAVLGSKRLKAIAVQGHGRVPVHDQPAFSAAVKAPLNSMLHLKYRDDWHRFGPAVALIRFGVMPDGSPAPELLDPDITYRSYACPGCPLGEKVHVKINNGRFAGCELDLAYYPDAINVWSGRFAAGGLREALYLRSLTNAQGLDDYTLAWMAERLMELVKNGVIDQNRLTGLNIDDPFNMARSMIEKVSAREGIGEVLAEGPAAIDDYFEVPQDLREPLIKGLEPMFDPRLLLSAIHVSQSTHPRGSYIVAGLGPDFLPGRSPEQMRKYLRSMYISEEAINRIVTDEPRLNTGRLAAHAENWYSLISCLGICCRQPVSQAYTVDNIAPIVKALTGMDLDPQELLKIGERAWNLLRLLNAREGFDRGDDVFPKTFFKPQEKPPHAALRDYYGRQLSEQDVKILFDDYYEERGWQIGTGLPGPDKISELNLEDFI